MLCIGGGKPNGPDRTVKVYVLWPRKRRNSVGSLETLKRLRRSRDAAWRTGPNVIAVSSIKLGGK